MYEHFRFVADKGQSLLRVDKFLVDRMMGATRNRIQLAAITVTGMYDQACRLIHHQQIIVLIYYIQRDIFGDNL